MSTSEDLTKLAEEIGKTGAADDSVMAIMAKGMGDALRDLSGALVTLTKGKKGPPQAAADDGDGGDDTDAGDDDDSKEDTDPGAGYDDLAQGADGTVDVSEHLAAMFARVPKMHQDLAKLTKAINRRFDAQDAVIAAQSRMLGELAKSSNLTHRAVIDIPEPGFGGTNLASARRRHGLDGSKGDPAPRLPKEQLVKARMKGVVGDMDLSQYNRFGVFSSDPTVNADLIAKVKAA